ncbi:hypothetical protein GCM10011531_20570 [Aquaticitalea lipolytica]|uniref:YtxH domain-containing protein n=1 Tax=Aquaticitalea lipolytica TaxID=1247562 RepID=A0A8J2TTA4_9FLAO|nr:YtxH domain-containing protein [Aquaticitalea lipolytica]GFZ88990.1 hypothetical protein GCM10011531_20570 [Aquaticitalea lipolytica]|tara:strand:- start:1021 stop:1473 length:453 start_codon:yes stop_codon:yes gene_type:complete
MSDEKKLSDDLNDMLGDAKEGAKKAAHKAEEFADEAKEKAKEFANEAKETFTEISKDGKNVAIIAHLTLIGWVIALIMNNGNKTELGSFYIRQVLGIIILALLSWIPLLGWIIGFVCFIMWIMSLISAINGEKKPVFLLGEQFQDWFKSL